MGFRLRKPLFEDRSGLDSLPLTPLLDIVFLVTIFFVLTSGAVFQEMLDVDLPSSTTAEPSLDKSWVIVVDSPRRILFNKTVTDLEALGGVVRQAALDRDPSQIQVSLAASRNLPYEVLVRVFDALRANGVTRISLRTQETGP